MTLERIIQNYNLSGAKLLIFAYLSEKEEVKISLREFSEILGISINTMKKYLEELYKEGLIIIEDSGCKKIPSIYRIRKRRKLKKGI